MDKVKITFVKKQGKKRAVIIVLDKLLHKDRCAIRALLIKKKVEDVSWVM